ncbi:hypothetical protein ZEAMMB73_Zm00001d017969 [Zea mays]|jgi:hypothetical protein|uniref:Uncharacterized protein n=1 Tax=Zea mays TaxID=4577 RepID=A0A1D6HJN0_MAIZE|nr:hypothetical protein ZEAMMB73_Zm00001d017969 [Zea mays]
MAVLKNSNLVLAALIMLLMASSMVLGSAAARPLLVGEELAGEAAAVGGGGDSIVRFIRQLYWQRLSGPGPSCKGSTWDPNNGCPPPP